MFLFEIDNVLFFTAIALVLVMAVIELVGFLVAGCDILMMIDSLLPDLDADPDFDDPSIFGQVFGWAKHKDCPTAIWTVIFLGLFGVIGVLFQLAVKEASGTTLQFALAGAIVSVPSILITSKICKGLGESVFKTTTQAVTIDSLIGSDGAVVTGTMTNNRFAEVKIRDKHGKYHYIMCRAATRTSITQGESVRLITIAGSNGVVSVIK